MHKGFFAFTIAVIVLGATGSGNAQSGSLQSSAESGAPHYDIVFKRTDAVIVTQSHSLPNLPGGGFRTSAKVAWALGEAEKVYALDLSGRMIDFDQLASIEEGLDKLIRAVSTSFDTLNATTMSYTSRVGISANYYSYLTDESDKPRRNLYLVAGSYIHQSPNTEALSQFRDVIAQGRQKLIALGAR